MINQDNCEGWHCVIYSASLKKMKYFKHPLADRIKLTMQDHYLLAEVD